MFSPIMINCLGSQLSWALISFSNGPLSCVEKWLGSNTCLISPKTQFKTQRSSLFMHLRLIETNFYTTIASTTTSHFYQNSCILGDGDSSSANQEDFYYSEDSKQESSALWVSWATWGSSKVTFTVNDTELQRRSCNIKPAFTVWWHLKATLPFTFCFCLISDCASQSVTRLKSLSCGFSG